MGKFNQVARRVEIHGKGADEVMINREKRV